jgi:hypothetical protein
VIQACLFDLEPIFRNRSRSFEIFWEGEFPHEPVSSRSLKCLGAAGAPDHYCVEIGKRIRSHLNRHEQTFTLGSGHFFSESH